MSILLAACGNAKKDDKAALTDKKTELAKLKKEQTSLEKKISDLEAEIQKADPSSVQTAAKLVGITPLNTSGFSHYIELQGRIDAQNMSYVAPANGQGGLITGLYVTQGQAVKKGQVLAKLDDQLIKQQIEPIRVQLTTAEDTYKRTKNLFDQGIGTYQNVLNAKTQVESLQKQIGIYQKQSSLSNITAPISGVADQVPVKLGEMYSPQMGPMMMIRIVNTGDLKVIGAVPEGYANRVSVGSRIMVVLPEQNSDTINAVVNVVQKVIDPTTRSFNIEAKLPSNTALKPNQVALIKILDYSSKDVVVVPVNVVQTDEQGRYVFVMMKEGNKTVARKKTVITGEAYGSGIEIKSGLAAGDQLITDGYQNLYEGQAIKLNL